MTGSLHACDPALCEKIREDMLQVLNEFFEKTSPAPGKILVVGCSSSEMIGGQIGHLSSLDAAKAAFDVLFEEVKKRGLFLAVQCCEHLNRAIVTEAALARRERLDPVCVIPQPKAGGSFATLAYHAFETPCVVEHIRADLGLDIGGTLIGMHLRDVAVPLHLAANRIGEASVLGAYTRPKYIGGERAVYRED